MPPARIMLIINDAPLANSFLKKIIVINVGFAHFTNCLVNTKYYGN